MEDLLVTSSSTLPHVPSVYTPCYCEENVYFLCKELWKAKVADSEGRDLFVVFISNADRQVPFWCQKSGKGADGLVVWDYHVICVQRSGEDSDSIQVWDLDSKLPFPVTLSRYINEAIRPLFPLNPKFRRLFRVVHAPIYLRSFASDRRHMKDNQGNWISSPPLYQPIIAKDGTVNNLDMFIGMNEENVHSNVEELIKGVFCQKFGVVMVETDLEDFFSRTQWQS
ncbi:hypothetical protein AMTR_s00107p00024990 [Amborella trichopoda]|uniref:Protein N-terminal glutamine amidohydrolase n=2 Tax=Amborella trichopoda TaxID=13333 RepID=W1P009_AMBTC|nr:hypothetical protein AMTR_s00107p00024990 [Amborella trichopoda]